MKSVPYLIGMFMGWSLGISAQQPAAEFRAYADRSQVAVDQYFELSFTLRNASGEQFRPPRFGENLRVVAGPSSGMSTTIINGRVSTEMRFSYTLQPLKPGKYNLPGATIRVQGRTLRSNPLVIEVLAAPPKKPGQAEEVFLRTVLSTPEAYVGQQIRLDYKLYTRVDIEEYNLAEEPGYAGFYVEDFFQPDLQTREEMVNGKRYFTRNLRSLALYPQQTGELRIGPALVQLGVVKTQGESFFSSQELVRVPVRTDPVTLKVKPLPPQAPASFSGAVGQFNFSAAISRSEASTDDAVTLTLRLEGDGDLKQIQPPALNLPAEFEVYEPRIAEEESQETETLRRGHKTIEYILRPLAPGSFRLQPIFTYFDVQKKQYVTLRSAEFNLSIKPGLRKKARRTPSADALALSPPTTDVQLARRSSPGIPSTLWWILLGTPVVLFGGLVWWQQTRKTASQSQALERGGRKAVRQQLQQAEKWLREGDFRAFYSEISKALQSYLGRKLNIPPAEWSRERLRQAWMAQALPPATLEQTLALLQRAEMALFAGKSDPAALQEVWEQTEALFATLENQR